MSIVLQSPALGKRKAIEDGDPCLCDLSSAKEETNLVEKEEAISAEGEANLVGKEEAILCEKKDATVDEKEEEDLEDEAFWQAKEDEEDEEEDEKDEAYWQAIEDEEEEETEIEIAAKEFWRRAVERNPELPEEDASSPFPGILCRICAEPGHINCPWARGTCSATVPEVCPRYQVTCKRCCNTEFERYPSNEYLNCTKCGSNILCAVRKFCHWCLRPGHTFNKDNPCKFPEWSCFTTTSK